MYPVRKQSDMKLSMPTPGHASLGIAAEKGTHVHRKSNAVDSFSAKERLSSTFKEVSGSGHGPAVAVSATCNACAQKVHSSLDLMTDAGVALREALHSLQWHLHLVVSLSLSLSTAIHHDAQAVYNAVMLSFNVCCAAQGLHRNQTFGSSAGSSTRIFWQQVQSAVCWNAQVSGAVAYCANRSKDSLTSR